MANNIIYFKGIKFYNYSFQKFIKIIKKGGYLVAPAIRHFITEKKLL